MSGASSLTKEEMYKKLLEAERQVESGKSLIDAKDVFEKSRQKYQCLL